MKIYDLKDKKEYLREVMILEHNEWAKNSKDNFEERINKKIDKYEKNIDNLFFCKLILLDKNNLVGFISIFPNDSDEEPNLSPWYATMFVKKEYRGKGYSKLLNDAIVKEAKKRNIKTLYLKTELVNYYEKFGAKYIKNLSSSEKLYKIDING